MTRDTPIALASEADLQTMQRRAYRSAPALTLGVLGLVAGLILVKFLLYVAAAQFFGGTEHALCQWDCEWYAHTIQDWYDPEPRLKPVYDMTNWAFFPLYPLLGRALRAVSGLDAFWSGTFVSILCFAGFAALSCRYRSLTRPQARQTSWIVLLMVYPFSLYFFVPYTESLYLLVTILLLLCVQTRNGTGAGMMTGLMTATRPTGVMMIPYLAVEQAWHARRAFRSGLDLSTRTRILANAAFPLALAPLGIACYMAYLYWLTGDALAFSHIQVAWDRHFTNPAKTLYWNLLKHDWSYLLDPYAPQSRAYAASYVIVAGIACLWLLARGLLLETWILGTTVFLALCTSVESIPRYVTANPAFLLVVGDLVDRIRPRSIRIGLAAASVLVQGVLLYAWFLRSSLLM